MLYPKAEPYQIDFLDTSVLHKIYIEQSGNPDGKPVLVIHGGPGGGTKPSYRRYFDPAHYRIILVDQRGCGKSTPHADLTDNTTQHLIADFESIRKQLGIERWQLFGGSWGTTLGLAYAQQHPEVVTELVLRGIFLGRQEELQWLYQHGTSMMFPEAWEDYLAPVPIDQRDNLILAYHKLLNDPSAEIRQNAAKAWSVWEASTSKLEPDPEMISDFHNDTFSTAFAQIENHYFSNQLFLRPNQLLDDCDKIQHIPTHIVHGRYDVVCPVTNAWELHKKLPDSELFIMPKSGHSISEPEITEQLLKSTEQFKHS